MSFVRIAESVDLTEVMVTSVYRPEPGEISSDYGDSPGFRDSDTHDRVILPDLDALIRADGEALRPHLADSNTPSSALIEVLPAPGYMLDAARSFLTNPNVAAATERLEAVARDHGVEYIDHRVAEEDEPVALVDPNTGLKPGLHIDDRDKLPLGVRLEEGRRRAGVNVGPGYRWLLIVFPDLFEMAYSLGYRADQQPDPNDVFHGFMDANPYHALRCFRIPIPPGMAYRMPADSIGHEGSSYHTLNEVWPEEASRLFMFLGHWAQGSWEQASTSRFQARFRLSQDAQLFL